MNCGLRERKKNARHAAFVATARELVREHGLDRVTIEDVCAPLGVSPRTFFNYFGSKEDAVLDLGIESDPALLAAEVAAQFRAGGPTGTLLADLQALAGAILADPVLGPARIGPVHELVLAEPRLLGREVAWMEQCNRAILEIVAERELTHSSRIDPGITGAILAALTRAVMHLWVQGGCQREPVTYLPLAVEQFQLLAEPTVESPPVNTLPGAASLRAEASLTKGIHP